MTALIVRSDGIDCPQWLHKWQAVGSVKNIIIKEDFMTKIKKIYFIIAMLFLFGVRGFAVNVSSFADLQSAIAGSSFDITFTGGFNWAGNLTVSSYDGIFRNSAPYTLSGINTYAAFSFNGITLQFIDNVNLTFDSFVRVGDGGAIRANGSALTFTNSKTNFSNNTAYTGNGGAIYLTGSNINVNNSTLQFINNKAIGTGAERHGGAIYMSGGAMTVNNSSLNFMNNTSQGQNIPQYNQGRGGAMYISGTQASIYGSTLHFIRNTAIYEPGGALSVMNGASFKVDRSSVIFDANWAHGGGDGQGLGGAISSDNNSLVSFTSSVATFVNNRGWRGGVFSGNGKYYFISSLLYFTDNVGDGGLILAPNIFNISQSTAYFRGNSGVVGNFWNVSAGTDVRFSSSLLYFIGNGRVANNESPIRFYNDIIYFDSNKDSAGAVFYANNAMVLFDRVSATFVNNSASAGNDGGGAYYLANSAGAMTSNSTMSFYSNKTSGQGGAFYIGMGSATFLNSSITFTSNSANFHGGALYLTNSAKASFINSKVNFTSNSVNNGQGGAFYLGSNSQIIFNYSAQTVVNFSYNTAQSGGAFYFADSASQISLTNTRFNFLGNYAKQNGGALYLNGQSFSVSIGGTEQFSRNSAAKNGGALYLSNGANVALNAVGAITFSANTAENQPNDIYADASVVNFVMGANNLRLEGGVKAYAGASFNYSGSGTLYFSGVNEFNQMSAFAPRNLANTITVENATWTYTSNTNLPFTGNAITFNNSRVNFISNLATAGNGGAFSAISANTFNSQNLSINFSSNSASGYGGAIYNTANSTVSLKASDGIIISGNKAAAGGGFYYGNYLLLSAGASSIRIANNSANSGASIYAPAASSITVNANTIEISSNTSGSSGGFLSASAISVLTLNITGNNTVNVFGNTASNGGFIYAIGTSKILISANQINISKNAGSGAAFYLTNSSMTIASPNAINISSNSATSGVPGGSIYASGNSNIFFNGSVNFISNSASGHGGAVYLAGNSGLFFNNSLINFISNASNSGYGGALFMPQSIASFRQTTANFTNNSANISGGAIFAPMNSSVSFNNSSVSFISNTASTNGGAIHLEGNSTVSFINTYALFSGNKANGSNNDIEFNGGGTLNINSNRNIIFNGGIRTISGTNFVNKDGVGDLIFESSAIVRLGNSDKFNLNGGKLIVKSTYVVVGGTFFAAKGTTISLVEGGLKQTTISATSATIGANLLFDVNISGAKYLADLIYVSNSLTLLGSTITAAYTGDWSGDQIVRIIESQNAINGIGNLYLYDPNNFLHLIYDTDNKWIGLIGLIWSPMADIWQSAAGGDIILKQDIVAKDYDRKPFGLPGSDNVHINGQNYAYDASKFANVGFILDNNTEYFKDISFRNFVKTSILDNGNGAVFNIRRNSYLDFSQTTNTVFSANTAQGLGGAVFSSAARAEFGGAYAPGRTNIIFNANTANSGGAIYAQYGSTINFVNAAANFSLNSASIDGGAVYAISRSNINMQTAHFNNNNAQGNGGAVYALDSYINITSGSFTDSIARSSGGAAYALGSSTLNFTNVRFVENTAVSGGAIFLDNGARAILSEISLRNNEAQKGAAVYIAGASTMTISGGADFFNNLSRAQSGAVHIANAGTLNLDMSGGNYNFRENAVSVIIPYLNGIYIENGGTLNISGANTLSFIRIDDGIEGNGTINKTANGTLLLNGSGSFFTGIFRQSAGITRVNFEPSITGSMFGGTQNYIQNSLLEIITSEPNYNVLIGTGGFLRHYNTSLNNMLNISANIGFNGSGGTMEFNRGQNLAAGRVWYDLEQKIDAGSFAGAIANHNKIVFNNAYVNLGLNKTISQPILDFTGTTEYIFRDSVISLAKLNGNSRSTWTVNFSYLGASTATLILDMTIHASGSSTTDILSADNFTAYGFGLGLNSIQNVKLVGIFNWLVNDVFTVKVLGGQASFDINNMSNIIDADGSGYLYELKVATTPIGGLYQNIDLTVYGILDHDTLYLKNINSRSVPVRSFTVPISTTGVETSTIYYINRSLTQSSVSSAYNVVTARGDFSIIGGVNQNEISSFTISGIIYGGGAKGALFDLSNITNFEILYVTISSAFAASTDYSGNGSVLRIRNSTASAALEGVRVSRNTAYSNGGAVYAVSGALEAFAGTEFLQNTAYSGNGGAVFVSNSANLGFSQTLFNANRAQGNGGAIYAQGGNIRFEGGTFSNNRAQGLGGALYLSNTASALLDGSGGMISFFGNSAGTRANDIHIAGASLDIMTDASNPIMLAGGITMASGTIKMQGQGGLFVSGYNEFRGAFNISHGILFIDGAEFNYLSGTLAVGGAVIDDRTARIEASNSIITFNGNLLVRNRTYLSDSYEIRFDNSTGAFNAAVTMSNNNTNRGVFYANNSFITVSGNLNLLNNRAANYNGQWNWDNSTMDLSNANIAATGNSVTGDRQNTGLGAVFYLRGAAKSLTHYSNVSMTLNSADGSGGALYAQDGVNLAYLGRLTLNNNASGADGGAISLKDNSSMIAAAGSFIGNSAQNGGAISADASNIAIAGGPFTNNVAQSSGGAIKLNNGGAGDFNGISFNLNKAAYGGAIFASLSALALTGGSFTGNTALASGGAAYIENGSIEWTDILFNNNTAISDGGALFFKNVQGRISAQNADIKFIGNASRKLGGAIFLENSNLVIYAQTRNISFSSNKGYFDFEDIENDIYLNGGNTLVFDASNNRQIEIKSGIRGNTNDIIIKSGGGIVSFSGDISFGGKVDLQNGTLKIATANVFINELTANAGTYLTNGFGSKVTSNFSSMTISNAIWDLGLYFIQNIGGIETDIMDAQFLDLSGLSLTVSGHGLFTYDLLNTSAAVFRADNIIGFENMSKEGNVRYSNTPFPLHYSLSMSRDGESIYLTLLGQKLEMPDLTHNESEVINVLNNVVSDDEFIEIKNTIIQMVIANQISQAKKALNDLSGAFLVNMLNRGFDSNDFAKLYWKLNKYGYEKTNESKDSWIDFSIGGSENKGGDNGKFTSDKQEILAGTDIAAWDTWKLGVYGSLVQNDYKQGANEGYIDTYEAGLYFMTFFERLNIIGNFGIGYQKWETQRDIEFLNRTANALFNASLIKGGFEADYDLYQIGNLWFKPFVSVRGAYLSIDEINEKGAGSVNLSIDPQTRFEAALTAGIKVLKSAGQFNYFAKPYYKYLLSKDDLKADLSFNDAKEGGTMDIIGMEENKDFIGAQGGIGYIFKNGLELFANADINTSLDGAYFGYLLKGGLAIRFGAVSPFKNEERALPQSEEKAKTAIVEETETFMEDEIVSQLSVSIETKEAAIEEDYELVQEEEIYIDGDAILDDVLKEEIQQSKDRKAAYQSGNSSIEAFNLSAATFQSGSARLTDNAKNSIKRIVARVKNKNFNKITIEGHTDSVGKPSQNLLLSNARAKTVYDELIKNGISKEKLQYIGFGSTIPIRSNKTLSGRRANRRVEIFVE
ncbi:MAG: OmpA family protein [Elusimicrobiota bacterium]|jgi:predicted outer membrane repeat protein|nr:OmpA family protein [Elusimicrobiota bacterium]